MGQKWICDDRARMTGGSGELTVYLEKTKFALARKERRPLEKEGGTACHTHARDVVDR